MRPWALICYAVGVNPERRWRRFLGDQTAISLACLEDGNQVEVVEAAADDQAGDN